MEFPGALYIMITAGNLCIDYDAICSSGGVTL
jgi:hypothetical protein